VRWMMPGELFFGKDKSPFETKDIATAIIREYSLGFF